MRYGISGRHPTLCPECKGARVVDYKGEVADLRTRLAAAEMRAKGGRQALRTIAVLLDNLPREPVGNVAVMKLKVREGLGLYHGEVVRPDEPTLPECGNCLSGSVRCNLPIAHEGGCRQAPRRVGG